MKHSKAYLDKRAATEIYDEAHQRADKTCSLARTAANKTRDEAVAAAYKARYKAIEAAIEAYRETIDKLEKELK